MKITLRLSIEVDGVTTDVLPVTVQADPWPAVCAARAALVGMADEIDEAAVPGGPDWTKRMPTQAGGWV
jgi:hypothetical protein